MSRFVGREFAINANELNFARAAGVRRKAVFLLPDTAHTTVSDGVELGDIRSADEKQRTP